MAYFDKNPILRSRVCGVLAIPVIMRVCCRLRLHIQPFLAGYRPLDQIVDK